MVGLDHHSDRLCLRSQIAVPIGVLDARAGEFMVEDERRDKAIVWMWCMFIVSNHISGLGHTDGKKISGAC